MVVGFAAWAKCCVTCVTAMHVTVLVTDPNDDETTTRTSFFPSLLTFHISYSRPISLSSSYVSFLAPLWLKIDREPVFPRFPQRKLESHLARFLSSFSVSWWVEYIVFLLYHQSDSLFCSVDGPTHTKLQPRRHAISYPAAFTWYLPPLVSLSRITPNSIISKK